MSKFVVTVFDDETAAFKGASILKELHADYDITVYAAAVVEKTGDGEVVVKSADDEGPVGTATGMLLGGMIGVFGGPLAFAAGTAAGSLSGVMYDLWNAGVDSQFLDDVGSKLQNGKFAVVAELSEEWEAPLDTRMHEINGTVIRRWRAYVEDDQLDREVQATEKDLQHLKAEMAQAAEAARAGIQVKIDAAKEALAKLKRKADDKVVTVKAEMDAKIEKLNQQIATCKTDSKARFEKKRDEMQASCDRQMASLKQAGKNIAAALS